MKLGKERGGSQRSSDPSPILTSPQFANVMNLCLGCFFYKKESPSPFFGGGGLSCPSRFSTATSRKSSMISLSQGCIFQSLCWLLTQPVTHYLLHYTESTPMAELVLFPFEHECVKQELSHIGISESTGFE